MQNIYWHNMLLLRLLVFFMLIPEISILAQIPVGSWRDHLPYCHGKQLVEYNNRIFCATSDGSLFSFSTRDNSIKKHSKVNGLSDADITAIGYSSPTQTFFIGYSNGNIDLIRNDTVINLSDIKRKEIMGEKSINQVFMKDNYAYLACGFGIIVCDLQRLEIKDTYLFGPGGSQLYVNDITSDQTYLYAATTTGIYKAALDASNLLDFNAWEHMTTVPDPDADYRFVACYNNRLFTVYSNPVSGFDDIIAIDNTGWEVWENSFSDQFDYLGVQQGYLIVASMHSSKIYGSSGNAEREITSYYAKYVLLDSGMNLWYASPEVGLVRVDAAGNGTAITPEGPAYLDVGDIEIENGRLWAGGGTLNSQWSGYGMYSFIDEDWKGYNQNTTSGMEDFLNISEISIDPQDDSHIIGGSYGYGIAEFQNGELTGIEDETGSVLMPVTGFGHGYVRITGTDFDQESTIYAVGSQSETAVYRKVKGQAWEAVPLEYAGFGYNTVTGEILATSEAQIWVLLQNSGLLVFKENTDGSFLERFITVKNQQGDVFDRVFSIAEDEDGDIWVGTDQGPVIYSNVEDIFTEETVTAYQPEIPRNDGTSYVSLLLSTEKITDIEVDGANRKWLSTEKSGVFLVSSDGKTELYHFTAEDSPLFSDNVSTVAVNDKTGEVFFATEYGLVAYRAEATEGEDDFNDVHVFPNPVRENFTGDITVTGLVDDVNVKITDIAGNLVYETTSLGGQAIWDGRNFRGERVQTGIYLIFCTNDDGSKTHITKLLFIH